MKEKITKVGIAREYRLRYGAETPTAKVARIMYSENKEIFKDFEDARINVGRAEGKRLAAGKSKESIIKTSKKLGIEIKEERPKNPYNIPESDEESFIPFLIKGHKKGLIINDIHIPYHSIDALTAAISFAKKEKPDFIFLNGDIVDFYQLSYFMKDPRQRRFSEELDMLSDFVGTLKKEFKCKIYYKFGNHEERYDHYLYQKAHELKGVKEFELEEIVKRRCGDIEIIRDKRIVSISGLPFIHGHEFGRAVFSPVNAARGLFLQSKHSAVKGDCHTTSEHTESDIYGKIMTTYSVGALCGLTPKWLPLNKWNHGFAIIEIIDSKKYRFRNYRIYKGEVL